MRKILKHFVLSLALLVGLVPPARSETVSTFALDSVSYISFQDQEILHFAPGSTIVFHFGTPLLNGATPFTISPAEVSLPGISLSDGQTLTYRLVSPVSGLMSPTPTGQMLSFIATLSATVSGDEGSGGALTYTVPFTTETVSAPNAAGTQSVEVTGARLLEGAGYAQIVGATVNQADATPRPGAAVYTVLSGTFDPEP